MRGQGWGGCGVSGSEGGCEEDGASAGQKERRGVHRGAFVPSSMEPPPSVSTSSIIIFTSSSVGSWPRDLKTSPSSEASIDPPPSESNLDKKRAGEGGESKETVKT